MGSAGTLALIVVGWLGVGVDFFFLAGITQLGFDILEFGSATLSILESYLFFSQEFFFPRQLLLHNNFEADVSGIISSTSPALILPLSVSDSCYTVPYSLLIR